MDGQFIRSEIIEAAMRSIQAPNLWERVLALIVKQTGARAAIITLRENSTCQIVNDDRLEEHYHSPLIYGFPTEAVEYYLNKLRTKDPWADAQRMHYPHRPTIMSAICAPEDHEDHPFFNWLALAGIRDSIVFEMERMSTHWTALNIFVAGDDTGDRETAYDFAEDHYKLLRSAWQSGQALARQASASDALFDHFSEMGVAAGLASAEGALLNFNGKFEEVLAAEVIQTFGSSRKLSFAENLLVLGLEGRRNGTVARHGASERASDYVLQARAINPDPMFKEKREKVWLLTLNTRRADVIDLPEHLLTFQEQAILGQVRSGESVRNAGLALGVQRSRAFEIWASVKEKLNIENAHQVRAERRG